MFARQTKDNAPHGPGPNGQAGPPRPAPVRSFEGARSGFVAGGARSPMFDEVCRELVPMVEQAVDYQLGSRLSRGELARTVSEILTTYLNQNDISLSLLEQKELVTELLNRWLAGAKARHTTAVAPVAEPEPLAAVLPTAPADWNLERQTPDVVSGVSKATVEAARDRLQPLIMGRIDMAAAAKLSRGELESQIGELIPELLTEAKLQLNFAEQRELIDIILDDMLGLGPLEPLLNDETITDIMVNGPRQVYIERRGKLEVTDVRFRDNAHVLNVATRIVSRIGRRIDESSPLVDARLLDGSRVNIIIPPLAIDGPSISIRKFSKKWITLDIMAKQANMSPQMAAVLKIASRCRLNVLISGGTGSGKTTLLNAMSQLIDHGERIVTIEDAAELQLQQPHVVRLETRPSNIEGKGEISMRDLVKNSLRMRPDRIILGEIRGGEALDMLQAMNTGHEGSMSTVHANRPREALTRLENMVGMSGVNLTPKAVRTQIASSINMIVQVSRMRDGIRRITNIVEVVGTEGDIITTQDLFTFQYQGESADGRLHGIFNSSGLRPHFLSRAEYFGLDRALLEAM